MWGSVWELYLPLPLTHTDTIILTCNVYLTHSSWGWPVLRISGLLCVVAENWTRTGDYCTRSTQTNTGTCTSVPVVCSVSVCSPVLSLTRPQTKKAGGVRQQQGHSIHVRSFIHASSSMHVRSFIHASSSIHVRSFIHASSSIHVRSFIHASSSIHV